CGSDIRPVYFSSLENLGGGVGHADRNDLLSSPIFEFCQRRRRLGWILWVDQRSPLSRHPAGGWSAAVPVDALEGPEVQCAGALPGYCVGPLHLDGAGKPCGRFCGGGVGVSSALVKR